MKVRDSIKEFRLIPTSQIDELAIIQGDLKNLEKLEYEKLKQSLLDFGFLSPFHLWDDNGVLKLLDGTQRLRTIKTLRDVEKVELPEFLPAIIIDAPDERTARMILLTLTSQYGRMTDDGLSSFMIESGLDLEFLKKYTRFPEVTYDDILDSLLPEGEGLCDEDEVPDVVEPKTKLGDIYQLGNHRLLCGDSTDQDAVEYLMGGEKADMVFTDPPYNQETDGGPDGPIASALRKQGKEIAHMCDFEPTDFLNILSTIFKGRMNAMIFTGKDLVVDYLLWAKESGFSYNILVWKKPNAIPIGGSYRPDIEYLLTFRKSAIFNSNIEGVNYSKVMEFGREVDKVHPTMKPVELISNQIRIGSNDSVLDLFGGSGSTLIACEKTSRKCFMLELDPHYCDVIVARWEKYTGRKAELI